LVLIQALIAVFFLDLFCGWFAYKEEKIEKKAIEGGLNGG
jgi:hypothetical protein